MLAVVLSVVLQSAAFGQVMTDEEIPRTFTQGLLIGFENPLIQYYHLGAIVGIGILAGIAARGIIPLLAFSAASVLGVAIQISPFNIPADEMVVALTTIGIGALVVRRQTIRPQVAAFLFAIAGLFHGYSVSESVAGAATLPLLAYIGGMLLVQLGVGTIACAFAIKAAGEPAHVKGLTVVGALVAVAGGFAAIEAMGLAGWRILG